MNFVMVACRRCRLLVVVLAVLCIGACAHVGDSRTSAATVRSSLREAGEPRVLIAYQTKYGSTRQYAQWINKNIPGDLVDVEKGEKPEFTGYDMIIFGSPIRMGRIVIAPLIVENWGTLIGKKVILFTASGTPPGHPNIQKCYHRNIPDEIRKDIKYFPLRGKIVSRELSFFDKFLVAVGRIVENDETLRSSMADDFDGVKPENLIPMLEYIRTPSFQQEKSGSSANH